MELTASWVYYGTCTGVGRSLLTGAAAVQRRIICGPLFEHMPDFKLFPLLAINGLVLQCQLWAVLLRARDLQV